jgi:hypothetical protein
MQILKRIAAALAYLFGIAVLLLIVLTVVSQTQFFKDRLRILLVSTISSHLNGTLHLGTMRGDFITGIDIDSLTLFYGDEPCITTGAIHLVYDPFALLEKKIVLKQAAIENPSVKFFRPPNGNWNIGQLFASNDTSASAPFDWTVSVEHLTIVNGTVNLLDSASLLATEHHSSSPQFLEYHNFSVVDINIALQAFYKEHDLAVHIENISLTSHTPPFRLTTLKGNLHTSDEGVEIQNLTIQTDRSSLLLNGGVKGLNILNGIDLESLEGNSTTLTFKANPVDVADVKFFLEPISFLDGLVHIDLDLAGRFGDLNIKRFDVQTYASNVKMNGELVNLHRPENLALDVYIVDSKINPSDASKLLKPFNIPSFDSVGITSISAHYIGKPLDFAARVVLNGRFGTLDIDGRLNLSSETPDYSLKFSSTAFDLSPLLGDAHLASSLFTKGKIAGKGFSPATMKANFDVRIDSAVLRTLTLTQSEIGVQVESGVFDISALLRGPEMYLTTETTLDFSHPQQRSFESEFSLYAVDLEKIFENKEFDSEISGSGTVSGSGTSLSDISLNANIALDPSRIRTFTSDEEHILIDLRQDVEHAKHLSIQTSLVDVEVAGAFDISSLVQTFPRFIQAIEHSAISHLEHSDSTAHPVSPVTAVASVEKEFDFHYRLTIKNLQKLSSIIGKTQFNGYGTMEGRVNGTEKELSFSSTTSIGELFIGNIKKGLFIEHGELTMNLENVTLEHPLDVLSGKTSFHAHTVIYNQTRIDSLQTSLTLNAGLESFDLRATIDSAYTVAASGTITIVPLQYIISIPHLTIQKDSSFALNTDTLRCIFLHDKLTVNKAEFMLDSARIAFNGTISDSENTDFQVTVRNFDLAHLSTWFSKSPLQKNQQIVDGTLDATITITHRVSDPVIHASVVGNNIHYKQTKIGVSTATLQYAKENVRVDITLKKTLDDTDPFLSITGTLPISITAESDRERFPDQEQHLQITSSGFELGMLEPLLPDFDQLSGTMTCNMLITGTPRSPHYAGTVSLRDGKFLFLPNYVRYTLSGDLQPNGEKIALKNFILSSAPEENIHTAARLEGTVALKDFRVSEFDVSVHGGILLMTNATRKRLQTIYGTLHAETDESGLHIRGNIEQPFLEGTMFIKEANLVFPPTKEFATGTSLLLPPIVIDDTTKVQSKSPSFAEQFYTTDDTLSDTILLEKFASESPLLSRLRYNLLIATEGETQIRMIFSQTTNEELYAELQGRINAVNNSGTPSLYGQISILNRSYYNFLKRFDASGKLKFIGQWDNPELEVNAIYQGTRIVPVKTPPSSGTGASQQTPMNEQRVFVSLDISGTRYQPRLEMSMKIQEDLGKDPVDYASVIQSGDVQADAIAFILTGKFRDELTSSDKENIAESWGTTAGTRLTSTFLSSVLTDFLQKEFSFIRSAELTYKGGNLQETADLRLSGVAGKGYWRFGGKIFNNLGNANVSYQLSLGELLSSPSIRNLFIELERRVEGSEVSIEENRKLTNTARMYYRFSF